MKRLADPPPFEYGCSCAAIRYRVTAPRFAVYACHCTDYQRRTGSAFTLQKTARNADSPCPTRRRETRPADFTEILRASRAQNVPQ